MNIEFLKYQGVRSRIDLGSIAVYASAGFICLYFLLSFLFFTLTSYWPGPLHDYWFEIPKIQDFMDHHLSWNELVTAHANAHRLVIPRLLFIADYVFFHGTNKLIVIIAILCKLSMLVLLNIFIKNETLKIKLILNVLIFSTIFNAINIMNILNSSNVQWDLMALFSCLAIYFYSRAYVVDNIKKSILFFLAYLFFVCAFFSQGGSLPVIFVFVLIAILNRSLLGVISSIVLLSFVIYLMAHVLPVNDEDNPGLASAIAMFIFKPKYVALFALKLMSANVYNLDKFAFVFSAWSILLLMTGFYYHKRTAHYSNNALLYIAFFSLLMIIFIAAFRVDFAPNAWVSNRYHPNVLLFILAVHLNAFLFAGILFKQNLRIVCRSLLVMSCAVNFWTPQYFQRGTPGDFANIVFETQMTGLFYGPNQVSARRLVTSLQEFDKIAEADPFFRKYGFAYYANKQGSMNPVTQTKKTGETLVAMANLPGFQQSCYLNAAIVSYIKADDQMAFKFSTPLNREQNSIFKALFTRDTFYALDEKGLVVGFAYLYVDPEDYFSSIRIEGLSRSPSVQYIAEIKNNQLQCRYTLNTVTP